MKQEHPERPDPVEVEAIKGVRLEYAARFDERDLDGLVSLFAPDAVCDLSGRAEESWIGVDAIRRGYEQVFAELPTPFASLHVLSNPLVNLQSTRRAEARWYVQVYLVQQSGRWSTEAGHGSPLFFLGLYEDDYIRLGDQWRFHRVHHPGLWPERTVNPIPRFGTAKLDPNIA